ncbi:MAG TPA: TerC/Alx family metal homeostasis membrane protein [Acidobacteriaceae bacterium]
MASAPLADWIGFHLALVGLLAVELWFARRERRLGRSPQRTALAATALWTTAAIGFALFVRHILGGTASVQYLAGFALEQSLSIDNLFVFLLLFRFFRIESARQPRVLFWGLAGAMVMRGLFVAGGIALLARFTVVTYLFAAILLIAAVRLVFPSKEEEEGTAPRWIAWLQRVHPISQRQDCFFTRENGRRMGTVLLLCLVAIELTDVVFALDSIPAVLSITRNPFLAYTSNIMAVIGLRSLYFLLIGSLARLRFLHYGLAAVLGFAAIKMLASPWLEVGPGASLATVVGLLALTVAASLLFGRQKTGP